MKMFKRLTAMALAAMMVIGCVSFAGAESTAKYTTETTKDGWIKVTQEDGETLGYSPDSGVTLIEQDGFAFKDLNKNGTLDVYEDWRLDDETRAVDLASKMTGEEIIPLMTHGGWSSFGSTVGDSDVDYIQKGGRAGTSRSAAGAGNTKTAVTWSNALQTLAESTGNYGIPVIISVDPVHISGIVTQTSLAATFDMPLVKEIGIENAKEYRAVGITMLLGPQVDLTSQPTWFRASGTYSEDPALNRDLANAYISGLQSTYAQNGEDLGWGADSVVAIVKHFAATGASEGGRDDHADSGKYMIFPGNDFAAHLIPFFDGAFKLDSKTNSASGLMPSYGIFYNEEEDMGDGVANAYNEYTMNLLRENGYDGFILTDWGITTAGRTYGVEELTSAELFARMYMLGNDQAGGTSDIEGALGGYEIMKTEMGEEAALARVRESARRFLTIEFEVGIFDNPYISMDTALASVYSQASFEYGRTTQEKSIVMLKNSDNLIGQYAESSEKKTVYIPYSYQNIGSKRLGYSWTYKPAIDLELAAKYFNVVTDTLGSPSGTDAKGKAMYLPEDLTRASETDIASCDLVIIGMLAPLVQSTYNTDTKEWLPASIQYTQYTATTARDESIAGDTVIETIDTGFYGTVTEEKKENRSYNGNTAVLPDAHYDYELLQYVNGVISDNCKTIVLMRAKNPLVWAEVEPMADAILLYFNGYEGAVYNPDWFEDEALLNVIVGKVEPSALLPYQQPASMDAVEAQYEDVPRDMECYVDANGNTYDFAFGMNWSGVINDERVQKYNVPALTEPATQPVQ